MINCSLGLMTSTQAPNGRVYATVDDNLEKITINGVNVPLTGSGDVTKWNVVKSYPVEIHWGDEITITGSNAGGPAGIIATFSFTNQLGVTQVLSTGAGWKCGGKPAVLQGANGVQPWGKLPNIDSSAQWLWSSLAQVAGEKATCSISVPRQITPNGKVFATVDDNLEEITINGFSVPLVGSGDVTKWNVVKSYPIELHWGDEISVTGSNAGGPAGIIATFSFTNDLGATQTLSTGAGWKCGGKPAVLQGANGVQPWGKLPNIDSSAQWLWSSLAQVAGEKATCTFKVPSQKNASIDVNVDNILEAIRINGQAVPLGSSSSLSNWQATNHFDVDLHPGDLIEIQGSNTGGPAGILATIKIKSKTGTQIINTGSAWTCGTVNAVLLGKNGQGGLPWGPMNAVDTNAQWIWNSNAQTAGDRVTCKLRIPRPVNGKAYVTVDNTLTSFTVNGQAIAFKGKEDDWTVAKQYDVSIYPGTVISICGLNTGGPAGILASFTYTDDNGSQQTITSGSGWDCGAKAAVLQGKNGVAPWGNIAPINANSQWMWNSLAQIAGDRTCCVYTVPGGRRPACRKLK